METNYVLIKDSLISNIVLLEDPTDEFLEEVRVLNEADLIMQIPEKFLTAPRFLSVGCPWDGETFIYIKPFPSWVLNADKDWEPPVPRPDDGNFYLWDEETVSWIQGVVIDEPDIPPSETGETPNGQGIEITP